MKKILYFDCLSGISGDMTIAALLDLGVDQDHFLNELKKIQIDGYEISIKKSEKNGIQGIKFDVLLKTEEVHVHRNLFDVEKIIDKSKLDEDIKTISKNIFKHVARAEAKIHGKNLDEVHFHEVGAIDSIVDIIGTAILINIIGPDEIYTSPIHIGTGFVKCAHGNIPVPAPATLEILKNMEIYSKGISSELVTPTGAAILKELSSDVIPTPNMEIESIGYGLGQKDLEITNVLRVYLGKKKLKKI